MYKKKRYTFLLLEVFVYSENKETIVILSDSCDYLILIVRLFADPPEIDVERSWVHSGEGYEAQLVCIVYGEPVPNVSIT